MNLRRRAVKRIMYHYNYPFYMAMERSDELIRVVNRMERNKPCVATIKWHKSNKGWK